MDPHNLFPEMNLRPDPSLDTPRTAKQNQETDKVLRNKYQAMFRSVRNILFLSGTFFLNCPAENPVRAVPETFGDFKWI